MTKKKKKKKSQNVTRTKRTQKQASKRLKATNQTKTFSYTNLGLHILDLLHAVGPIEEVTKGASSIGKNLIIQHRLQHTRLRSEGFFRE